MVLGSINVERWSKQEVRNVSGQQSKLEQITHYSMKFEFNYIILNQYFVIIGFGIQNMSGLFMRKDFEQCLENVKLRRARGEVVALQ